METVANMNPPGILGLPEELLHLIVSHLCHRDDLRNLCSSSSVFREPAMAALYRRFEIDLHEVRATDDILKSGHAIHKHIKHLIVSGSSLFCDRNPLEMGRWSKKLALLLRRLPRGKLDSICTPSAITLSPELLAIIFSRQQNLRYIQLGPVEVFDEIPVPQLGKLEAAEVPANIGSIDNLRFYGTLLSQSRNIKALSIRSQFHRGRDGVFRPIEGPSETESSLVLPRILGHISQDSVPLKLEKLLLNNQKLLGAERLLTPYISFEHLHELQIHECDTAWLMLSLLEQKFKASGSALKVFSLHVYTYQAESNRVPRLEAFLESFEGLRFLEIRWDANIDPDFQIRYIEGHLPTLTDLCISFMDEDFKHNWYMDERDVERLLEKAPNLRQLAVALIDAWPDMPLYDDLGEGLKAIIFRPTNLQVLRILNWPLDLGFPSHYRYGRSQEDVDELVNRVVRYIARCEHSSALRLLVVGDWRPDERFCNSEGLDEIQAIECVCYFPGTRTNCFGRTEIVGIRVAGHKVRHEFPFWDIYSSEDPDLGSLGAGDYNLLGRRGPFTN